MDVERSLVPPSFVKRPCGLAPATLQCVLDYIGDHLAQPLTQAELAAIVHLSPYHFARLFRQAMAQSLHQYIMAQRIETAAHLLVTSQLTITEIALQVGFTDQSHFHRYFKRHFGVTPKMFVEERTNVQWPRTNVQETEHPIS